MTAIVDVLAQSQFAERRWVWVADKDEGYVAGWITEELNDDNVVVAFTDGTVN